MMARNKRSIHDLRRARKGLARRLRRAQQAERYALSLAPELKRFTQMQRDAWAARMEAAKLAEKGHEILNTSRVVAHKAKERATKIWGAVRWGMLIALGGSLALLAYSAWRVIK